MDKNRNNRSKLFKPNVENPEEADSQSTSQHSDQRSGNVGASEGTTAAASSESDATAAATSRSDATAAATSRSDAAAASASSRSNAPAAAASGRNDSTSRRDESNNNPTSQAVLGVSNNNESNSQPVQGVRPLNPFGDNGPSTSQTSFFASEGESVQVTLESSVGRSRVSLSLPAIHHGADGGSDSEGSSTSIRVKCQDLIEATIDSCYSDQDSRDDQSTPSETSESVSRDVGENQREYYFGASSLGETDKASKSSKKCVTPPNVHGWRESNLDYYVSGGSSNSSRKSSSSKRKAIPDDLETPRSIGSSGNSSTVSSPTGFDSPSALSPRTTNLESPRTISIARRTLNLDAHPPENPSDGSEQSSSSRARASSLKRRLLDAYSEELASGIFSLGIAGDRSERPSHSLTSGESTGQSSTQHTGTSDRSGDRFRHMSGNLSLGGGSGYSRNVLGSAYQQPSDIHTSGSIHETGAGVRGLAQTSPTQSQTLSPTQIAGSMSYHSTIPHHQRIFYEAYYSSSQVTGDQQQPAASQPLDLSRPVHRTEPVHSTHRHRPSPQAAGTSRERSRRQRHKSENLTAQSRSSMQQLSMLQTLLRPNRESLQPPEAGAQAFIFPPEAHQSSRGPTEALPDSPSLVAPPPYQPRRSRSLSVGHTNPLEGQNLSTPKDDADHTDAEHTDAEHADDDQGNF